MKKEFYEELMSSTMLSSTKFSHVTPVTTYMNVELWNSFIDPYHAIHAKGYSEFDSGTRLTYTYLDQLGELE